MDVPPRTQQRKPSFPVGKPLLDYLRRYRRERELPVTYERLRRFSESAPLPDAAGKPTLWETVVFDQIEMESLQDGLKRVYAILRVDGDLSVMQHLYVDRIDFCAFGNSAPDRKSTRLNSSHTVISYAVFCLKKKKKKTN